ncbi:MAG TPA: Gfo/Idh/MocA family oxidoreductase [Lachnospiraceae bacterium]|nr:Gfo/Idh/MocA family oxidoreductase [Lachnospiraceae bacterium]
MKILMVGLGSIGQRHVRNLRRLYGDNIEFIAYRVRRLQQTFSDAMKIRDGVSLEEEYHITCYTDYEEALDQNPDAVFITNITSKHMECALSAAKRGYDIFMEKPVSDSMEGVEELKKLAKENQCVIFMGFQNRYHICTRRLREILDSKVLGKIVSVDAAFCERLTTMHTYEDYSTTYMARKDMGGGPILNLQIHDIDILQWIFGMPEKLMAVGGKNSNLKIDVEDHAVISYQTIYEGANVTVTTRSDFLQFPPTHRIVVVGEKGRVELDYNKTSVLLYVGDEEPSLETYPDFQRNDMFCQEEKDFFASRENRQESAIPLQDGIDGLKIALAAKKSIMNSEAVLLNEI